MPDLSMPAFSLRLPETSPIPILIAAPHGGRAYDAALFANLRHDPTVLLRLEDRYIDLLAERVADATGAALLTAHVPRAVIDLNRAPDDIDWEMIVRDAHPLGGQPIPSRRVRSGLGLFPRRLSGLGELWRKRLDGPEMLRRIEHVHMAYHGALAQALDVLKARWGAVLLLDLHSMPPLLAGRGMVAAQLVLGDRFGSTCHSGVVAAVFAHFAQCGREIAHNRPYAGGYVLERHGQPAKGIHAIQLEIDRSRYLDAGLVDLAPSADDMVADLIALVRRLGAMISDLGAPALWPHAAE